VNAAAAAFRPVAVAQRAAPTAALSTLSSSLHPTATASCLQRASFHSSTVCWEKLNVEGLAKKVNLDGKNVLVRVDLNVPLAKVRQT
jgi:hypothetical protein